MRGNREGRKVKTSMEKGERKAKANGEGSRGNGGCRKAKRVWRKEKGK